MYQLPSPIWNAPLKDLKPRLEDCVSGALGRTRVSLPVRVYFRADDIGAPGKFFFRLMDLFHDCQIPLCLAVVPSWLSRQRWEIFHRIDQRAPQLWCWHQHGWRHVTHELQGKKQEFGPVRSIGEIEHDIMRGRVKLEQLMKDRFTPVFTPPWNRCDGRTLALLKKSGFKAVSRHHRSMPKTIKGFPDFSVNVDLHTRRETLPEDGWLALFREISAAISCGTCGVMIHHQRMNSAAFDFLETFLSIIGLNSRFQPVHFKAQLNE